MDLSQNSVNEEMSDSLSASQYDSQTFEEWTVLSSECDDTNDTSSEDTNQSNKENENLNVIEENDIEENDIEENDKVSNNETHENYKGEENGVNITENISDNDMASSDIDVIDSSDDEQSIASLCSSSVISQMSTLSFLKDQYLMQSHLLSADYLNEDLSEASSLNYRELSTEVELKRGVRAYVHTPNTPLNVKLNLVLILSVTAVLGLGIGNFIGWSKHWNHQKQLSLGQVRKLKQIQDELVVCMQNQDLQTVTDASSLQVLENAKVCYSNSDYWKEKFEKLFSENRGLHEVLEKTQKHYHLKGNHDNILSDKECDNKSASDEFHKLKLGFLVKQMEHLQVLEEVKFKEKQSENRAKVLEAENSELKMKLVEEEADDQLIVESWGNRVAILESENKELRSRIEVDEEEDSVVLQKLNDRIQELQTENDELQTALNQLEAHVKMVGRIPAIIPNIDNEYTSDKKANLPNSPAVKLDVLRQTINQMVMENEELKTTIARLRWSSSNVKETEDEIEMIEDEEKESSDGMLLMEEQLMNLRNMLLNEKDESRKWKEKYEEMMANQKLDKKDIIKEFEESMFSEWIWNLTDLLRDGLVTSSSTVGDHLKFIIEQITQSSSVIPDEIYSGINTTQSILYDLNERLQNKWQELQHIKTNFFNRNDKITNKMSKLLENTLQKLQEARNKLINADEAFELKIKNFSNRIAKLIENLDAKWKSLIDKWSKRYAKYYNTDKANTNTNWMFDRANARREQQKMNDNTDSVRQAKSNWIFKRAKDREILRVVDDSDDDDDDNDEEYRNWYFKREKKLESDNDYDSDDQQLNSDTNSNQQSTNKESYTTNVYSKQR